ncbi:hypothetical protein BH10BAC1_BH10BAC1_10990 [soil metagenome]
MKKIILLFAAIIAFTATNAQQNKTQKPDATTKATGLTQKMAKVLTLTEDQKTKVQAVNLETVKLMELNQKTNADKPNELEVEKQRITKKWDADMTATIGAEQVQKWKKHQADEKAKN